MSTATTTPTSNAHTYLRVDKPGALHVQWTDDRAEI